VNSASIAVVLLTGASAFFAGCSKPHMTVTASPWVVDSGGTVRVSGPVEGISTTDSRLTYKFAGSGGAFLPGYAPSTPAAFWVAPAQPGSYTLSVTALDGETPIAAERITVRVRSAERQKLNVEYEAPPQVILGGLLSEKKTLLDQVWHENPHTLPSCTRIVCEALTEGCRITWATPPGNFGDAPGKNLSWAKRLTFWARGHYGLEEIWASAGADPAGRFPSTLSLTPDPKSGQGMLKLTVYWKQYSIPLSGDLSNLSVLFDVLIPPAGGAPVIIYLDDIVYE
jgi:hypothetical protein